MFCCRLEGLGLGILLIVGSAIGQDGRKVVEPKIPASCVQLSANLQAVSGKLAETDERKLDTERIQKALDTCTPGMAVELKQMGGRNAFLTGPLELRSGVCR